MREQELELWLMSLSYILEFSKQPQTRMTTNPIANAEHKTISVLGALRVCVLGREQKTDCSSRSYVFLHNSPRIGAAQLYTGVTQVSLINCVPVEAAFPLHNLLTM